MMLIDTHIHVGNFFNMYFSPLDVSKLLQRLDVNYYAVSSTTICEENYRFYDWNFYVLYGVFVTKFYFKNLKSGYLIK